MDGVNVFGTTTVYFVNQKRACVGALVRRAVNASHVSITYHHHFPDFAIPFSTSNDTLALDKSVCPRHHSVTRDGSTRCARRRVRPWQSRPRPRGFRCASRTRGGLSVPRDAVMTAWFVARFRLRRGVPVGAAFHRCRGARAAGARMGQRCGGKGWAAGAVTLRTSSSTGGMAKMSVQLTSAPSGLCLMAVISDT